MVVLRKTPKRRPAIAKIEHTSDTSILVGIDISEHRHKVLIAVPGKTHHRRMTITNTTEDFMRLIAILREYGLPVRIGFEATGSYDWMLWADIALCLIAAALHLPIREAIPARAPAAPAAAA